MDLNPFVTVKKNISIVDYRGTPVTPGAQVAYNLSGNVAIGVVQSAEITKVTKVTWGVGYECKYDIRIVCVYDHPYRKAGEVSKVTNPMNVVVLGG